ncbi:MAG: GGDEF domain-containing protein [Peptococcales bacterium]
MKHIKSVQKNSWSLADIKEKTIKTFQDNNSVLGESAVINIRRIYYLSIIAIPLRIIVLFTFSKSTYDTLILQIWREGILASHFTLLIFMIGFFLITRKLKNRTEPNTTMYVLQYIVVVVIMASGIAIVTLDQLVTSNITPFLLICIICGTVFLIRPLLSFILYVTSYVAYYNLLALTISNQQVLLSNRVNGITAIGIGFLLSLIMWHYNYTNITQKRCIEIQQKQLEQMAYYDPLTDLPNRRLLEKMVRREFSSMQCYGHETIIIILDIDNFKSINDTYGHPVGDNILKQLADLLKNNVRESDTVSRFGGEEFIILMPKTSVEGGYAFAERLRKLIMEKRFTVGSITLQITSSFGVSSMRDINSQNLDDYYFLADKALYLAKQCGKNRVEIACGRAADGRLV